jgi:two-component system sensor histidine kinase/response regulator
MDETYMVKKVLVVDDNPDLILSVKIGLTDIDKEYKVIGANGGQECLEILKKGEIPDLILLDIMMPDINGWDVAAELKKNPVWREIPIIFLTAVTDPSSKTYGQIVSADYIEKPFNIEDLQERIEQSTQR